MTSMRFHHAHVSGLWDADRGSWLALISSAARVASVLAITEFTQNPVEAPRGWGKVHFQAPGANECAIMWYQDVWEATPESAWCIPISKTPYALGSGKIRPRVHLLGIELRHKASGKVVNFEVFHTPSAIEGRNSLVRGVRRVKALLECFSAIRAHRKLELKGEASVLSADWNVNLKFPWVRALLRVQLRGFRNAWRKMPDGGSHGKRLIDGARFTRKLRSHGARILSVVRPFDHRVVVTEFSSADR